MIITKSPLRISLGGGGTDLPQYYKKYGGYFISGAINKYVFVSANQQFYDRILLKYSQKEDVKYVRDIKHNLFRESLRLLDIDKRIELTSLADIPSGTGLGSSGAFLIALLNTLYHYKNKVTTKRQLAEDACKIIIEILKEHEGKQDPYASAFGGINLFEIDKSGKVTVHPIPNQDLLIKQLEKNLFLFFIGERQQETASNILKEVFSKNDIDKRMHKIKEIGKKTYDAFLREDYDKFGVLLDEHWKEKKKYSVKQDEFIDKCYDVAKAYGALGGKVIGAGENGFFMFYHCGSITSQWEFVSKMEKLGLHKMEYKFDTKGVIKL